MIGCRCSSTAFLNCLCLVLTTVIGIVTGVPVEDLDAVCREVAGREDMLEPYLALEVRNRGPDSLHRYAGLPQRVERTPMAQITSRRALRRKTYDWRRGARPSSLRVSRMDLATRAPKTPAFSSPCRCEEKCLMILPISSSSNRLRTTMRSASSML